MPEGRQQGLADAKPGGLGKQTTLRTAPPPPHTQRSGRA